MTSAVENGSDEQWTDFTESLWTASLLTVLAEVGRFVVVL